MFRPILGQENGRYCIVYRGNTGEGYTGFYRGNIGGILGSWKRKRRRL